MGEINLHPLLVLHLPEGHDLDPQALAELRQYMQETYDAAVLLNRRTLPGAPQHPRLLGHWDPHDLQTVLQDVSPRLSRVFFNLDWLGLP